VTCPDITKSEVGMLRQDGIEPTLDELAELIELGRRVHEPPGRTNPLASRAHIRVGVSDLMLPPLSAQAMFWLDGNSEKFATLGAAMVCYAAANGRRECAFDELVTWRDIVARVRGWAACQTATNDELQDAAEILMGEREPESAPEEDARGPGFPAIMAELANGSGQTVDYWLAHTSAEVLGGLEAIATARAAIAGVGGDTGDSDGDQQRMRDLMWCVERIRARAKAEAE